MAKSGAVVSSPSGNRFDYMYHYRCSDRNFGGSRSKSERGGAVDSWSVRPEAPLPRVRSVDLWFSGGQFPGEDRPIGTRFRFGFQRRYSGTKRKGRSLRAERYVWVEKDICRLDMKLIMVEGSFYPPLGSGDLLSSDRNCSRRNFYKHAVRKSFAGWRWPVNTGYFAHVQLACICTFISDRGAIEHTRSSAGFVDRLSA